MSRRPLDDDDDDDSYVDGSVGEELMSSVAKTWAAHTQPARNAFETSVVRYIAAAFKPSLVAAVVKNARDTTGDAAPTFADLDAVVDGLAVRFAVATKLKRVHEVTADLALSKFTRTPFYLAYLDLKTSMHGDGDDRPLVVVFSWPRVKGGRFMTIHEFGSVDAVGVKIVSTTLDRRGRPITLTVEPLAALLSTIC